MIDLKPPASPDQPRRLPGRDLRPLPDRQQHHRRRDLGRPRHRRLWHVAARHRLAARPAGRSCRSECRLMEQISLALPSHGVTQPVTLAHDPASMTPTDEIAAWADSHQRALLIDFYAAIQDKPLDVVADAIRAACHRGFGVWMEPPAGNPAKSIRPGTHLIEIALFGVTGSGLTPLEAANSWRIAARCALDDGEVAE